MSKTKKITITAILSAIAMIIPLIFPKLVVPPGMSMTIASHTPIWIAMFISPYAVVAVVVMQSIGYLWSLGLAVFCRSLAHIIFALIGSIYIKRKGAPKTFLSNTLFATILSVIHAVSEVLVIAFLFFPTAEILQAQKSAFQSPLMHIGIAVGLGTFIHSMMDFVLAKLVLGGVKNVSFNKQQSK